MTRIATREELEQADSFGPGASNDAYAQYFTGDSFLKPLTNPDETAVFLAKAAATNGWSPLTTLGTPA